MGLLQGKGLMVIASLALAAAMTSLVLNVYVMTAAPSPTDGDDDLESRVTELENRVTDLESRMDDIEGRMEDIESRVTDLENRMDDVELRLSDLENGNGGGETEPVVVFASADPIGPYEWRVFVEGVSETTALSNWEAVLLINDTVADTMDPLTQGTSGNITFTDLAGEGNLTIGDYFRITCNAPVSHYEIVILWASTNNARGSEDWYN